MLYLVEPKTAFLFYDLKYKKMIRNLYKVWSCFLFANMLGSNEVSAHVWNTLPRLSTNNKHSHNAD